MSELLGRGTRLSPPLALRARRAALSSSVLGTATIRFSKSRKRSNGFFVSLSAMLPLAAQLARTNQISTFPEVRTRSIHYR